MSHATMLLLAAALGMIAGFGLCFLVSRPYCRECGAKAMPNQTRALAREARRADRMEGTLLLIAESSAPHVATLRALAWETLRETER